MLWCKLARGEYHDTSKPIFDFAGASPIFFTGAAYSRHCFFVYITLGLSSLPQKIIITKWVTSRRGMMASAGKRRLSRSKPWAGDRSQLLSSSSLSPSCCPISPLFDLYFGQVDNRGKSISFEEGATVVLPAYKHRLKQTTRLLRSPIILQIFRKK